jgi:hypothetical protein
VSAPISQILAIPALRLSGWIAAGVLLVGLVAGTVRVLPLLLAPQVPLRFVLPLGRTAAGAALETALLLAPSLGWALSSGRLVDRGEARALFALGISPMRMVGGTWRAALVVVLAAGLAAASWGREAVAPGRLVRDLLSEARAACIARAAASPSGGPALVDVPLLGVSWVCFPGEPPRALGPVPLGTGQGALSASEIEPSDDLRSVHMKDISWVLAWGEPREQARIRVGEISLRGLSPLGRASNLNVSARTVLLGLTSAAMAALAAFIVLSRSIRSRPAALLVGLSGPAAALMVFSALERAPASVLNYVAVPAAGLLALTAAGRITVALRRSEAL